MGQTGRRSIATHILAVKIALATAPFSWLRGGPPRAMDHFGEYQCLPLVCSSARGRAVLPESEQGLRTEPFLRVFDDPLHRSQMALDSLSRRYVGVLVVVEFLHLLRYGTS